MFRINNKKIEDNTSNKDHYKNQSKTTDNFNSFNKQIVDYIYSTIEISRFKYEILKHENEMQQLLKQKYLVSANFSGTSSLLVFTKIKDKFYSCLIDRSTLKYNHNKIDFNSVEIFNVNIGLDSSIYLGTILDGTNYKNKNENIFIITDVYSFKGQDYTNTRLDIKLHSILTYLKTNYDENNKSNNIVLTVNRTYPITETEHLISNVIPNMKNITVKGICFYPEISGSKLIYFFNNTSSTNSNNTNNYQNNNYQNNNYQNNNYQNKSTRIQNQNIPSQNTQFRNSSPTAIINSNSTPIVNNDSSVITPSKNTTKVFAPLKLKDINYVFEMKKTIKPDVYDLNVVEPDINYAENKVLRRKKIGLAFIPDINKSQWCKSIYETKGDDKILVSCKYHEDKQKWEPVDVSSAKRPSLISELQTIIIE